MTPRQYRMDKRALGTASTRRRIVEATMALHREQGIAATTMKDIAARADVGIGTVYHHFPRYEDAILACGERTAEVTRPPTPEIFAGVTPPAARIEVLVAEVFAYYDRHPTLPRARCDQDRFPMLADFVKRRERLLGELARAALEAPAASDDRVRTVVALTDFAVHRSLLDSGLSTEQAARRVAEVLVAWLGSTVRVEERDGPDRTEQHHGD